MTKIELIDGSSLKEGTSLSNASINSISTTKLLKNVEKSYDKGKKLLGESQDIEIQDKVITTFGRDISKITNSPNESILYKTKKAEELISGSDNSHLYVQRLSDDEGTNNISNRQKFGEENDKVSFRIQSQIQKPVFVSNAQLALDKIKQEKATPQQWLAMLEKNAGIKACEDKWLGLSD